MEFKYMTNLLPGDVFVFHGEKPVEVKKIEHDVCGPSKVHINNSECYEALAVVNVKKKEEAKNEAKVRQAQAKGSNN